MNKEPHYSINKASPDANDLIQCLLKKNKSDRIKPVDIPNHPWFKDINLNDINSLKVTPSFMPKVVKIFFLITK
jgi:serine/threonine protein kinase